jgi:hypothetical protein
MMLWQPDTRADLFRLRRRTWWLHGTTHQLVCCVPKDGWQHARNESARLRSQPPTTLGRRHGKTFDARGYVEQLPANLFQNLTDNTRDEFNRADGNELRSARGRCAKMHALHCSSALAVNVFQYWRDRDVAPLAYALGIPSVSIRGLQFERLSPIAAQVDRRIFKKDPNIDVVIHYSSGAITEVGIESKFEEAYGWHPGLKVAYLQNDSLWHDLSNCHGLAQRFGEPSKVKGVNFPQLLKHVLGLKQACGSVERFWLLYLWYATPTTELGPHFEQLREFQSVLRRDNIQFCFLTYQELIRRLAESLSVEHGEYIDYLAARYL